MWLVSVLKSNFPLFIQDWLEVENFILLALEMPRQHDARYYFDEESRLFACPCRECHGELQIRRTFDRHKEMEDAREVTEKRTQQPNPLLSQMPGTSGFVFTGPAPPELHQQTGHYPLEEQGDTEVRIRCNTPLLLF